MRNEIIKNLEEELKGAMDYYSFYYEYLDSDLASDFKRFADEELEHAKFWLDLLEVRDEDMWATYKEQYDELVSLFNGGDDYED